MSNIINKLEGRLETLYNELDYQLKYKNINDVYDLNQNKEQIDSEMSKLIKKIMMNNYYLLNRAIFNVPGIFFTFEGTGENVKMLSKYSCIFPNRTIIQSSVLLHDINKSSDNFNDFISDDIGFVKNYFFYKQIIRNHIAIFAPCYIEATDLTQTDVIYNKDNIAFLNKQTNQEEVECLETLNFAVPWLYNSRIEDYIELKQKYNTQFECLNLHISNLSKMALGKQEFTNQIIHEMKDSCNEMTCLLQKKQSELKAKGIYTILGLCMTSIPYIIKDIQQIIDPTFLSALIGSSSMKELLETTKDFNTIKNLNRDNPFWLLWKWKLKTEKKHN